MLIRISDDALARATGADALAAAFEAKGHEVHRVSSWGMHWLEPLVDVDGQGFGPATLADVDAILGGSSTKAIGAIAEHPFIKGQQRLTFARAGKTRPTSLDDYAATGGWDEFTSRSPWPSGPWRHRSIWHRAPAASCLRREHGN